jgi:class 3 adenylate cyclase
LQHREAVSILEGAVSHNVTTLGPNGRATQHVAKGRFIPNHPDSEDPDDNGDERRRDAFGSAIRAPASDLPRHRAILAVDIEGSTSRTNTVKALLRAAIYDLLEQALNAAGLTESYRDPLIDRGDGVLALIHPVDNAPKALLLSTVIPVLGTLLTDHNDQHSGEIFRIRAVVHAGEVLYDSRGCFGEDLDVAFRLLDAPQVKARLRHTTAPLILVVSDDIHRSVIRHGYDGIDASAFVPQVLFQVGGGLHRGWLHLPESAS